MRIVFVSQWYSEKMGYIENCLPFSMANLGHEVHLVTTTAQVYFYQKHFKLSYGTYLGEPIVNVGNYIKDGVTIHRLPFWNRKNIIYTRGLIKTIKLIKPDIVHALDFESLDSFRLAYYKNKLGYKLFTAQHAGYSVFPVARNWENLSWVVKKGWFLLKILPGRYVSEKMEKCFTVTTDAADVAEKFMGVDKNKIQITTLGVNTRLFKSISSEKKIQNRNLLGFKDDIFLCLYSGRLTAVKQPLVLAEAVAQIKKEGFNIDVIFIGAGEQMDIIQNLGFKVMPLQPYPTLPEMYSTADAAVWAGEESISQLDCVAAGLNLVLTDKITAYDLTDTQTLRSDNLYRPRIVSYFFKNGDVDDLKNVLKLLIADKIGRQKKIEDGMTEIRSKYSWDVIAAERVLDYQNAM